MGGRRFGCVQRTCPPPGGTTRCCRGTAPRPRGRVRAGVVRRGTASGPERPASGRWQHRTGRPARGHLRALLHREVASPRFWNVVEAGSRGGPLRRRGGRLYGREGQDDRNVPRGTFGSGASSLHRFRRNPTDAPTARPIGGPDSTPGRTADPVSRPKPPDRTGRIEPRSQAAGEAQTGPRPGRHRTTAPRRPDRDDTPSESLDRI